MIKHSPIRMCIACRTRESQKTLIRLQIHVGKVVRYQGEGRSIYLCKKCSADPKKTNAFAKRFGLEYEQLLTTLKELDKHG